MCVAPMPILGFCLTPFVNLNPERMVGGLMFEFRYGKLH